MSNKKVIITAYSCCPNRGSEPGNGWNWIINYAQNGFFVEVYTSGKYKKEIDNYILSDESKSITFHFIDTYSSLKLLHVPSAGIYLHYFVWLIRTRKLLKELGRDISLSHFHHVTYSSVKFGTPLYNLPSPIIIGPLGGSSSTDVSLKKYFGKYWKSEKIKENIGYLVAKTNPSIRKSIQSSSLILISNDETENLIRSYDSNVSVKRIFDAGLADYFLMDLPVRDWSSKERIILWVGRMLPRKGLNLAIDAFSQLHHSGKGENIRYKLIVAGDGELLNENKALVKKLDIEKQVTFLGKLDHQSLIELYSKAHVFLFPSLKDSCPMQVFEAMATGLPVVTLNHQGMSDQVVSGAGIKVEVNDKTDYPRELSNAIKVILNNHESYLNYSKVAYDFGQNQIWSVRIKDFISKTLPQFLN